ncbi:MAG: MFS transporter [Armatimonadota bacterium]
MLRQNLFKGFYYGWGIIGTLAVTEMVSWGILYYAFSVLQTSMAAEMGWTRPQMTGAFSLSLLIGGLAAIPVGIWLDHHGPRRLMTLGSLLGALLVFLWSGVSTLTGFYWVFAGIGLVSAAVQYEPAFAVAATWFQRRRNHALTIITLGGGMASPVFVPLTQRLNEAFGWRSALVTLAILLAVLTVPAHALVLRRRPQDRNLLPDGDPPQAGASTTGYVAQRLSMDRVREALRDSGFWWLTIAFLLTTFIFVSFSVHLIPCLIERGFSPKIAASALAGVGFMQIPGRILFAPLTDRLSGRTVVAGLFIMQSFAIAVFFFAPNMAGLLAFVTLFGMSAGAGTPSRAALTVERYGAERYGSIAGVQSLTVNGIRAAAPFCVSLLREQSGGYNSFFVLGIVLSLLGTFCILLHDRRPFVSDADYKS